jgi:hypothetical protein
VRVTVLWFSKLFLIEEKSRISENGMLHFTKGNWNNLQSLKLYNYDYSKPITIGNKGCKYLSRVSLPNLTKIILRKGKDTKIMN